MPSITVPVSPNLPPTSPELPNAPLSSKSRQMCPTLSIFHSYSTLPISISLWECSYFVSPQPIPPNISKTFFFFFFFFFHFIFKLKLIFFFYFFFFSIHY